MTPSALERNKYIRKRLLAGATYQSVADELGLTRQRVHQLVASIEFPPGCVHGRELRRVNTPTTRQVKRDKAVARWGMSVEERMNIASDPSHKKKCALISMAKHNARAANVPFNLTYRDLVMPVRCPALGIKLSCTNTEKRGDNSPSLDRIVPARGYVKGNVIIVSWRANRIKNNATTKELTRIAEFYSSL